MCRAQGARRACPAPGPQPGHGDRCHPAPPPAATLHLPVAPAPSGCARAGGETGSALPRRGAESGSSHQKSGAERGAGWTREHSLPGSVPPSNLHPRAARGTPAPGAVSPTWCHRAAALAGRALVSDPCWSWDVTDPSRAQWRYHTGLSAHHSPGGGSTGQGAGQSPTHEGVSLGRDRTSAQPQLAQEAAQPPRGLFLNPEALSSPAISSSPPARPGGWPGRSSPALPAQPPAQGGRGAACPQPPGSLLPGTDRQPAAAPACKGGSAPPEPPGTRRGTSPQDAVPPGPARDAQLLVAPGAVLG